MLEVEVMRRAHDDPVQSLQGEQFLVVFCCIGDLETLLCFSKFVATQAAYPHHLDVRASLQHRYMVFDGPPTGSDDSDSCFLHGFLAPQRTGTARPRSS